MTEHDRTDFATLMLGLGETYGEPVSDARMEIYFNALADLELADIRVAATAHVWTQKFFPRPSELRDALEGSADDRAEMAWVAVLQLVRRYGYYRLPPADEWPDVQTRAAAMGMYGGWGALCAKLPGEGPELLGAAKLFKASFSAFDAQARRGDVASLPAGREQEQVTAGAALGQLKDALMARGLPTHGL